MNRRKVIGQRLPRPNALKLGDLAAIPLSNGAFGYGRQYRDAALGILDITSDTILPVEALVSHRVAFFVSYCEPIDNPEWIYLGKWKFTDEDSAWGPAQFIQDIIDPATYRIYERGKMRAASRTETNGLSKHVLLFPEHVRERIEAHFFPNQEKQTTHHEQTARNA
jgi:hypothetical protein